MKVFIVQIITFVQFIEILGEVFRTIKVIYMKERFLRSYSVIVFLSGSHHYGQDVVLETIDVELLRDVVHTVGVLEGKIELVMGI